MSPKETRHRLKTAICLSFCLLLLGCGSTQKPMGLPLPDLTYSNLNPYSVFGGSVTVVESHKQRKFKSDRFVMSPSLLLKRYADNRFYTSGEPRTMIFDIKRATITHATKESGLVGYFVGADKDIYHLDVSIVMSVVRPDGTLNKPFTIAMERKLEVSQGASIAEREFAQFEFLEKAMTDIDRAVTDIVIHKLQ